MRPLLLTVVLSACAASASAQTFEQRGFVEGKGRYFPQTVPQDDAHGVADLLAREEVFWTPAEWFDADAGIDFRANSHDEVEDEWRFDVDDRTAQRPRLALRRAAVNLAAGAFSVKAGKQFIRWGRADILNPTDRFAPRDYLTVLDTDFLAVTGVRPSFKVKDETFEVVVVPRMTPSRIPLLNQRWAVAPPILAGLPLVDLGADIPEGTEYGARWAHTGSSFELALTFFDGFNDLPNLSGTPLSSQPAIGVTKSYPAIRSYGADFAIPTSWFLIKGEVVSFDSTDDTSDEYVLYVIQLERQVGEWSIVGGYAGESVSEQRQPFVFAPDRGIAKSFLGRVAYTVDPRRTFAVEGAVRQEATGAFVRGEYTQTFGAHWRMTIAGVGVGGEADDFLGQYEKNSNATLGLRFSF